MATEFIPETPTLPQLDAAGREVPDQTPIVLRVRGVQISQYDQIKAFVRRELSDAARGVGAETFEEANDFDVPDDEIRHSPHEYTEEQQARDEEAIADGLAAKKAQQERLAKTVRGETGQPDQPRVFTPKTKKRLRQMYLEELLDQAEKPDTTET